jgi:hypothetical protein
MKKQWSLLWTAGLWFAPVLSIHGQDKPPLKLIQKIPLPNVKGRIDHMDVDVKGKRLFVAGLENGTLEVVDLKSGKWARSIPGLKAPQGVAYLAALNKVFVANENDDTLKVFRGDTLGLLSTIRLDLGANRVTYDPHTKKLYVGYGGASAKKDHGEVGVIDAENNKHVADIQVGVRPAEILMDKSGQTLFVFDSVENKIQVVDTQKRQILSTWPVSGQRPGDGALDEATHRLFIGTRIPPFMIVMDSASGKEVAKLPTSRGWMASILMRLISASTFPAEEASRLARCSSTSNTTPITTRKSGIFPRLPARALRFGRRNSIVFTSLLL